MTDSGKIQDASACKSTFATEEQKVPFKVILWCTPRSSSTTLTKCLSFIPDTDVWFETFSDAYHFGSDAKYPDVDPMDVGGLVDPNSIFKDIPETIGYDAKEIDYTWCKQQLENCCNVKKNVLVKDGAYAIDGRYDAIPRGYKHTFLICEPSKVILSKKKALYNTNDGPFESFKLSECDPPRMPTGFYFKEAYNVYNFVKDNYDPNPVVIDSDDLLMNPSGVLKTYCDAVGIPYNTDMLHWDSSCDTIKTWNISKQNLHLFTPKYYARAFCSSGFTKRRKNTEKDLSNDDQQCVEFCMPFYKAMFAYRLRVP